MPEHTELMESKWKMESIRNSFWFIKDPDENDFMIMAWAHEAKLAWLIGWLNLQHSMRFSTISPCLHSPVMCEVEVSNMQNCGYISDSSVSAISPLLQWNTNVFKAQFSFCLPVTEWTQLQGNSEKLFTPESNCLSKSFTIFTKIYSNITALMSCALDWKY